MAASILPTARNLVPVASALLISVSMSMARAEAPDAVNDAAKQHFRSGVAAMRLQTSAGYAEAYREFKAAYAAAPESWRILGNLAQAADELERDGEAIDALEEYLSKGGVKGNAKQSQQLPEDLERLRNGVATVTLEAPGTLWIVDTRLMTGATPVVNQYGPFDGRAELRVRAGEHEFQLEGAAAGTPAWAVTLKPGDVGTHSFELLPDDADVIAEPPAPEPVDTEQLKPPTHLASYVFWGVGALGASASTILYLDARKRQRRADDAFDEHCPRGADYDDAACVGALGEDATAANRRTAALVVGVGALGALVTGTVLYWLDQRGPEASGQADGVQVRPWMGSTAVGISGTF